MSDTGSGIWRDEERLPVHELERAMGASAQDGQLDDTTGHDAGQEQAYGHGAEASEPGRAHGERAGGQTDEHRGYRPSTTGRTGPH